MSNKRNTKNESKPSPNDGEVRMEKNPSTPKPSPNESEVRIERNPSTNVRVE